MASLKKYWVYILLGLVVSFSANLFLQNKNNFKINQTLKQTPKSFGQVKLSFADAVKQSQSSVVNLFSSKRVANENQPRQDNTQLFNQHAPDTHLVSEAGSGVIVSDNGYIITNHHVINNAENITITLNDGRVYPAEVIGNDSETDLAVLKINEQNLNPIMFAKSEQVEVGDIVLAIGNPFGQGQSVSMGIISATGKDRIGLNTYENFIQTDAAINPGNSGGALVNQDGELVGINSAIFSRSGGSQGIGFAIPVSIVKNILLQIVDKGYVTRGWLGIEGKDITTQGKVQFKLPNNAGVYVTGVYEDGPAYKAGIKSGDILIRANDIVIKDVHTILKATEKFMPGSLVIIQGQRNGKIFTTEMLVQQRPLAE